MNNATTARKTTMRVTRTPTSILIVVSLLCLAGGGWAELVSTVVEVCNVVDAREPVRPMKEVSGVTTVADRAVGAAVVVRLEERALVVNVAVEDTEVLAAADCSELSIVENGYGSSEVVKVVSQQFTSPRPCPAAPAQHQLLSLDSQRLTSVKPLNWPLRNYSWSGSYEYSRIDAP